ncbi:NAD(P)(+)--arginine ADP-ribosyltransferase 2-like [Agelaius phoeniceus]|uniref:NAD(P)(+)--arginine ADP-ribosyltransferase 2-like n=1 Tax=Agelaius phoeniceus TaxID=39638 RepID=UPI0040551CCE
MTVANTGFTVVPLDMAGNSFDDQHPGCRHAMTELLPALNHFEFQQNPLFAQTWMLAAAEWWRRAIALMTYTMKDVYKEFNATVHVAGHSHQQYRDNFCSIVRYRMLPTAPGALLFLSSGSVESLQERLAGTRQLQWPQDETANFPFKTLHFLRTQALVTLRDTRGPQCHHVSLGVPGVRFEARCGDTIRFGRFTSTSLHKQIAQQFGTDAMFQVQTCYGVDIQEFSSSPTEEEVLIPPLETFEVTSVTQEGERAVIQLRSSGTFSRYSCEWL